MHKTQFLKLMILHSGLWPLSLSQSSGPSVSVCVCLCARILRHHVKLHDPCNEATKIPDGEQVGED